MDILAKLKNISIVNYSIGTVHYVDIAHIENPSHFYVRPSVYRQYLCVLSSPGDKPAPDELNSGTIAVFKSKLLKRYVRGRVTFKQIENEKVTCDMFSLDYGFFEKSVSLRRIRKPQYPSVYQPLAVLCELADCKPYQLPWSTEAIDTMKYYVENEQARIVVRERGPYYLTVELLNSCPDDISTMIVHSGHADFGYEDNLAKKLKSMIKTEKHYFTYKMLELGETLTVRFQYGDSLTKFYVAGIQDYERYLRDRDIFTSFCEKQRPLQLEEVKQGMFVGVFLFATEKFERARVNKVIAAKQRAEVQLVDWGKSFEVPFIRLVAMTEIYFVPQALAIYCSAEDSQIWDNGLLKYLRPGYEFRISVTKIGNELDTPHIVHMSPKFTY